MEEMENVPVPCFIHVVVFYCHCHEEELSAVVMCVRARVCARARRKAVAGRSAVRTGSVKSAASASLHFI